MCKDCSILQTDRYKVWVSAAFMHISHVCTRAQLVKEFAAISLVVMPNQCAVFLAVYLTAYRVEHVCATPIPYIISRQFTHIHPYSATIYTYIYRQREKFILEFVCFQRFSFKHGIYIKKTRCHCKTFCAENVFVRILY